MSVISIASIIGQPFWGHYCDKKGIIRNILVGSFIVSGAVAFLIPVFFKSYMFVILICLVLSFTENSMPSIIDSWTVKTSIDKPWIDYGLTRGLGSLGYSITAVVFGVMLDKYGFGLIFYAHAILILVTVGFCFFVENNNRENGKILVCEEDKIKIPKIKLKESGEFIWFVISATFVFIGFRAASTFYPLLLSQKGGDNKDLGLSLFIMAVSEVPVLFLSRKLLLKYKDTALITVSMIFFILRLLLHILVPTISGLIAVQATQALSFAVFLPAAVHYIKRISPAGLGSTYLTIGSSCYYGIGGIIGSIAGGFIIDKYGIYNMFWIGIALTVIGMLLFIYSTYTRTHTKYQVPDGAL